MFPFSGYVIYLAVCYLVAGSMQTLSLKFTEGLSAAGPFTSEDVAPPHHVISELSTVGYRESTFFFTYNFAHPFAQAFFMFIAESLCLVVMLLQTKWSGNVPQARVHHPLVYLVPAAADFLASVIQNVGLFLTYASVYQMLRGATVVWIAILSRIIFKRHYFKIQKWGIFVVMLGLTLVGLSSVYANRSSKHSGADSKPQEYPHQMLGNFLIVSAQVLHAIQGVAEERLMSLYDVPPLQVVGVEGLFGLCLTIILLAFLQVYPMSPWGGNVSGFQVEDHFLSGGGGSSSSVVTHWDKNRTTELLGLLHKTEWSGNTPNDSGNSQPVNFFPLMPYDDIHLAFTQMWNNSVCLWCVLLYIVSGLVYNVAQISIIKLLSAAATVMIGSLRNISVWLACLALPFFKESVNPIQLTGFCLLVLGNILFQRVLYENFEAFLPRCVIQTCPLLFSDGVLAETEEPTAVITSPTTDDYDTTQHQGVMTTRVARAEDTKAANALPSPLTSDITRTKSTPSPSPPPDNSHVAALRDPHRKKTS